jgi:hypothetical protein
MTVSIFGGPQHKKRAKMDHVCHIALNQKPIPKFKKWCKFSRRIRDKSCKKRPACTVFKSFRVTTILNEIKTKQTYLLPCHLHQRFIVKQSFIKSFQCISQDAFCYLQSYCKLITQSSCYKEDQKQLLLYFLAHKTHFFSWKMWPKFDLHLLRRG